MVIGLKPVEWNEMTPREFILYYRAHLQREKMAADNAIAMADYTAYRSAQAIGRLFSKRGLPSYEKWIEKKKKKTKMTDEEMLNEVIALNRHFGGEEVEG